jgi:hypothetical protein
VCGTIAIVLIVEVETVPELDHLLTSLAAWPQMETEVTLLTTFDGRRQSLLSRLAELKAQAQESETSRRVGLKPRLIFGLGAAAGLVGSIVAAALVLPLLVSHVFLVLLLLRSGR